MTILTRHFTPLLLFSIPGIAVVWGVLMVHTALTYPDALVVDDYYKDGKHINVIRDRADNAARLHVHAKVVLSGVDLSIQLSTNDQMITCHFSHVVDASKDLYFEIHRDRDGLFRVSDPMLEPLNGTGIWYVSIAGTSESEGAWRMTQRVDTPISLFRVVAR
ncbi:MAG: FixH family protein [Pseudomonadota bacterium]